MYVCAIGKNDAMQKAQMTVYLTLTFAVLIPIFFTMIEATRYSAMKLKLECVTDMGMNSTLAEYDRELLEQYSLLFVDTGYGQGNGALEKTRDHLRDYMEYNLHSTKGLLLIGVTDFHHLEIEDLEITKASRATDEGGEVFRYMATSYMREHYGMAYVADAMDLVQQAEGIDLTSNSVLENFDDAQEKFDEVIGETIPEFMAPLHENITDPLRQVRTAIGANLLYSVGVLDYSRKEIDLSTYASQRDLIAGEGPWEAWEERSSFEEKALFHEYILLKTGNYKNPKNMDSYLEYQTEYIICGYPSDAENLREVCNRIFLLRGAANTIHFHNDEELQLEAEALALVLAVFLKSPEMYDTIKNLIVTGWILLETYADILILYQGGKIPLIKRNADWNIFLNEGFEGFKMALLGDQRGKHGQDYRDYLRILMAAIPEQDLTKRTMDIVEMDVRGATGNSEFRLDECVAAFTMQMISSSDYGYEFLMTREFGYY